MWSPSPAPEAVGVSLPGMAKLRLIPPVLLTAVVLLAAAPAHAQGGFGLRTGYSIDPDQFYVGAHIGVGPLVSLGGGPALNFYDFDGGSETQGGLNFMFGVAHRGGFFGEVKAGVFDSPDFKIGFGYTF